MKYLALFIVSCILISEVLATNSSTAAPQSPETSKPTQKPTTKPVTGSSSNPVSPTTQLTPTQQCQNANKSCDECVKVGSVQCVWCASTKKCMLKEHVIPTSECGLADAKWAVCWVNYEALIIACSVIGGVIILALTVCICCCCCCKKDKSSKFCDAETIEDISRTIDQSSKSGHNVSHIVGGPEPFPFFDWKTFFAAYFKPLKNISKYHMFRYAKEDAKFARKKEDMKAAHAERRAERKAKTDEIRRKYGLIKEDNPYTRFDDNAA